MKCKKFAEAEKLLLSALEKNPSDPTTQMNLIICYQMQAKALETVKRQISQFRATFPTHHFVRELDAQSQLFDTAVASFKNVK
jgi:coatomer protein complex subunit epsilon